MNSSPSSGTVEQLCPRCGLCCDSTLFADVELRAGDDAARLRELGLPLELKSEAKRRGCLAFLQPCAGFDGRLCRFYADRPKRCRWFECGLFKRVESGTMTPSAAGKKIAEAKRRAEQVRALLRLMGQGNEHQPLAKRYAAAMSAPVDLSDDAAAERQGELMLAVNDLMNRLQQDFLQTK